MNFEIVWHFDLLFTLACAKRKIPYVFVCINLCFSFIPFFFAYFSFDSGHFYDFAPVSFFSLLPFGSLHLYTRVTAICAELNIYYCIQTNELRFSGFILENRNSNNSKIVFVCCAVAVRLFSIVLFISPF